VLGFEAADGWMGCRGGSRPLKKGPEILGTCAHRGHRGDCARIHARGEIGSQRGSAGFGLGVELLEGGGALDGRPVGLGHARTGGAGPRAARKRGERKQGSSTRGRR
jgi:hypothetical protein